jgi:hypothetical protein
MKIPDLKNISWFGIGNNGSVQIACLHVPFFMLYLHNRKGIKKQAIFSLFIFV